MLKKCFELTERRRLRSQLIDSWGQMTRERRSVSGKAEKNKWIPFNEDEGKAKEGDRQIHGG